MLVNIGLSLNSIVLYGTLSVEVRAAYVQNRLDLPSLDSLLLKEVLA